VLRVASTPVSFEMFVQGAQTSLLQTWPDFPFGIVGLALLAIHFVAAIPAAPMGLAVIHGSPAAERALRGLGVLYLFVFPVGTVLGLAALASMGRSSARPVASGEPRGTGDRTLAALCYAVPVVSAIYVFAHGPTTRFVRVHAIQSSALFLAFWAVAKLVEALQPMTTFPIQALVGTCLVLVLALLAFVTFGGRDFRLPFMGELVERTQEGFERGQQALQVMSTLSMHQRNLAAAAPGPPPSVVTAVEGTRVANGFEQHIAKGPDRPLMFVAGAFALMLLLFLWSAWGKLNDPGSASVGMIVGMTLFFGSVIGFFIYLLVHKFLAGEAAEGWLLVRNWPLKPGADVRMQYKARPRGGGKIESIIDVPDPILPTSTISVVAHMCSAYQCSTGLLGRTGTARSNGAGRAPARPTGCGPLRW